MILKLYVHVCLDHKVQHNMVKHQTLPHPKSDEVIIKRQKIHIFQYVKVNPNSTGLELCVPVRIALKGLAERRSCLGRAKIKIRFLVLPGFHFILTSRLACAFKLRAVALLKLHIYDPCFSGKLSSVFSGLN